MRDLYKISNPQVFENVTPKLAAQLKNENGVLMRGIAFGQEPDPSLEGKHTFNNLREGILVDMYRREGISPEFPDYENKVREKFKEFKIDPNYPAFNYPPENGTNLFSLIAANSN